MANEHNKVDNEPSQKILTLPTEVSTTPRITQNPSISPRIPISQNNSSNSSQSEATALENSTFGLKRKLSSSSSFSSICSISPEAKFAKHEFKINKLNGLLNCQICNELFDMPITLPCGDTICKKHISSLKSMNEDSDESICLICDEIFTVSLSNIPLNKNIQEQINLRLNELDFGESYAHTKAAVEELNTAVERIGFTKKNFHQRYFELLKQEVIEEREEKKRQIDLQYKTILNKIATDENELSGVEIEIRFIKSKLDTFFSYLNTFKANEKKWEEISLFTTFYKLKLDNIAQNYQNKIYKVKTENIVDNLHAPLVIPKVEAENELQNGFRQFKLPNYKIFTEKNNTLVTIERFKVNNCEWNIEFGNESPSNTQGAENFNIYLYYCCSDITKLVDVDFLFEFVNVSDPFKNKILQIPMPSFSYTNDCWHFNVRKEIVDEFYDEENDAIHFCVYLKPSVKSIEDKFAFQFN